MVLMSSPPPRQRTHPQQTSEGATEREASDVPPPADESSCQQKPVTEPLHDLCVNGLTFDARFDSGNAQARVEALGDDEFALWTRRDGEGTPYETGCRTWFSFSVRGANMAGRTLAFRVHNMNSQGNLFRHDMRPCFRALPAQPEWTRLAAAATHWGGKASDKYREMRENRAYSSDTDGFVLRFEHTVDESCADSTLYVRTRDRLTPVSLAPPASPHPMPRARERATLRTRAREPLL